MSVLRVRGYALPDGEPVDLYADADQWTTDGVASAQLAAEGWLVPGLVDAHTHPGAEAPGHALDRGLLAQMAAQGTVLTPTLAVISATLQDAATRPDGPRKDWYLGGASVHGELAAAAAEAGVTVLAGTDYRTDGSPPRSVPSRRPGSGRMTPSRRVPGQQGPTWGCRAWCPARPPTPSSTTPIRAPILTSWITRGRSSCAASSGTAGPESTR